MVKSNKSLVFQYSVSLFRQVIVLLIIVAVAALALFWESLPASVNKTVTSLSTKHSNEDDITPPKFRVDNHPKIDETIGIQPVKVEYRNIQVHDEIIDDTLLHRLRNELMQLGATSCRLTYWGDSRTMFRFSCQVPVSEHHPNVTRTFQSIAPDATQSIQEVIDQIRKNGTARGSDF